VAFCTEPYLRKRVTFSNVQFKRNKITTAQNQKAFVVPRWMAISDESVELCTQNFVWRVIINKVTNSPQPNFVEFH
jgi:hypothetical protein